MGKVPADLRECCAILGLGPSTGREDIKMAFALNRRDLEMAGYDIQAIRRMIEQAGEPDPLSYDDPAPGLTRVGARSHSGVYARPHRSPQRSALNSVTLLSVLVIGLLAIVCFFVWPLYGYKLRSFNTDDSLVEARTGDAYGTVLEIDRAHEFPNGKVAPAYRLRLAADGREVWYPINDVHYCCVRD